MCGNRSSRALEYILNGVQREFLESSQKTQSSCPPWSSLDRAIPLVGLLLMPLFLADINEKERVLLLQKIHKKEHQFTTSMVVINFAKIPLMTGVVAQWLNCLWQEADSLSSIPKAHLKVEGDPMSWSCPLASQVLCSVCVRPHVPPSMTIRKKM